MGRTGAGFCHDLPLLITAQGGGDSDLHVQLAVAPVDIASAWSPDIDVTAGVGGLRKLRKCAISAFSRRRYRRVPE
jgi:hypothetical protein